MAAINLTVNRLIRISYGPFRLGEMEPGQVEEIKGKVLRDQLGEGRTPEDEARPRKPTRSVLREGKLAIERNAAARVTKDLADRGIEPAPRRSFGTSAALNALSKTWDRASAPKTGAKPLGGKTTSKPTTAKPTRPTRNGPPKRGPKGG
jgi:23S rRNA pseudouridine2605 synthase